MLTSARSLESLLPEYLGWKRLAGASERTIYQYGRDLARVAAMMPSLDDCTSDACLRAVCSFTPGQQRRTRAVLNDFLRWSVMWDHLPHNPMERVPAIRQPAPKIIDVFDDSEELALCSLPDIKDRALMCILFQAGLRKGEARHMRVEHVLMSEMVIRVPSGKGGKGRLIPFGPGLLTVLDELFTLEGLNRGDYLWYGVRRTPARTWIIRDHPVPEGTFHRWWERCLVDAGICDPPPPGRSQCEMRGYRKPHTARHTFATKYLQAGGRIERLSRILGHSSVAVTDRVYAHLTTADLADDLRRVLSTRGLA